MKQRQPVNLEASVRQRLKNLADSSGRPFSEVLQWYAIERFLAKFAETQHVDGLVLKGAALFRIWDAEPARPTMDIDLGAPQVMTKEETEQFVCDCIESVGVADGLVFDPDTIECQEIRIAHRYPGIRVRFRGSLGVVRITVQVDVGFADTVVPPPVEAKYPTLLGLDPPRLKCYRPETVIAEKLEAMVNLGLRTSRMKDYFDLWWLATHKDFEGQTLIEALTSTFNRRGTEIPADRPVALSDRAAASREKETQWSAFVRRMQLRGELPAFSEVIDVVAEFVMPVFQAAARRSPLHDSWLRGGPWQASR